MRALAGMHRTVFDLSAHKNGKPLGQAKNYFRAWRYAFHGPEREVNLVFGVHGDRFSIALTDALWSRVWSTGARGGGPPPPSASGCGTVRRPMRRWPPAGP